MIWFSFLVYSLPVWFIWVKNRNYNDLLWELILSDHFSFITCFPLGCKWITPVCSEGIFFWIVKNVICERFMNIKANLFSFFFFYACKFELKEVSVYTFFSASLSWQRKSLPYRNTRSAWFQKVLLIFFPALLGFYRDWCFPRNNFSFSGIQLHCHYFPCSQIFYCF